MRATVPDGNLRLALGQECSTVHQIKDRFWVRQLYTKKKNNIEIKYIQSFIVDGGLNLNPELRWLVGM